MMSNILNIGKSRSKSKTPDEQCPPCPNTFLNYMPQPSTLYAYQPQPHIQPAQAYHQHQVYPQAHQPIQTMPMSTCPHHCQSHVIQSPQHYNNINTTSINQHRPNEHAMVLNNHTIQGSVPQATQQYVAMPAYQANQLQSAPMTTQSSRYSDNSYYSNHMAAQTIQQQQQPHQQQSIQQQVQPQNQQQHNHQQQQQTKLHIDEQRMRLQYQQQQTQNNSELQMNNQISQQTRSQQDIDLQRNLQIQQQQQYQNHHVVNQLENVREDCGFSLETLGYMHDQANEELCKLADVLENDLTKLSQELEKICKETPKYSVSEVKI